MLSQSFVINITDEIVECNETFSLIMVSASTCRVAIGNINISDIMIIDNDSKHHFITNSGRAFGANTPSSQLNTIRIYNYALYNTSAGQY